MYRIGAVNIDTSHPKAFAEYLRRNGRGRYAAVYNDGFRGNEEVTAFMESYELERRCSSIEELADCSDIGFIHSCNWDRHVIQAMPFIEMGKPVFIDKPLVGKLSDCLKLEKLSENGAVILGSSSLRYAKEITDFINMPESERGSIVNVSSYAGVDEFNYGIHAVEAMCAICGNGAVSVRYMGCGKHDNKKSESYFVKFKNGISAQYHCFTGVWQPHVIVVTTTKTTFHFSIDVGNVYQMLLDRISNYMEHKDNRIASVVELTEAIKIMLAGRISLNQQKEINIEDISVEDPGFDGEAFEKAYAAASAKIYLK